MIKFTEKKPFHFDDISVWRYPDSLEVAFTDRYFDGPTRRLPHDHPAHAAFLLAELEDAKRDGADVDPDTAEGARSQSLFAEPDEWGQVLAIRPPHGRAQDVFRWRPPARMRARYIVVDVTRGYAEEYETWPEVLSVAGLLEGGAV